MLRALAVRRLRLKVWHSDEEAARGVEKTRDVDRLHKEIGKIGHRDLRQDLRGWQGGHCDHRHGTEARLGFERLEGLERRHAGQG